MIKSIMQEYRPFLEKAVAEAINAQNNKNHLWYNWRYIWIRR